MASEEVDNQVKSGIKICLKTFLKDKTAQEKELPNSFTAAQRAYVHQEAKKLSLLSKSRSRGFNRFVTIYKKDSLNFLKNDTKLNVTANTRKMAMLYSTQYQLTRPERQDLTPNFDRDRPRQESCRTMSPLTPGIPQVPVRLLQDSTITAQASDIVMASLKNHQSVVILKCASSNPKTRLLYLSQLILNDASERNVKLKVVTTIKAGRQPKEYAEFLSNERKESITLTFGYQDKLESQVSPCSVFTVCHNEILLRSLMGNDSILTCMTHIIIDGVDDNDRFCDLLLLVLRDALSRHKQLKLILLVNSDSVTACKTYFPQFNAIPLNEPTTDSKTGTGNDCDDDNTPTEPINFMVLCLYAKLLAPPGFPIADFLARISEPPSFQTTRTNVQALETMEALNTLEDLTELGNHLLDLPVEPQYGKMLLYAINLKCLDPVLTIVSCLSVHQDLFQGNDKGDIYLSKSQFAENSHSDHMVLLRAFQAWQNACVNNISEMYCIERNLNNEVLEIVTNVRIMILGHLRACGFVRAKGPGDIKDLNAYADHWGVIKASLTAGMYPNVAARLEKNHLCVHQGAATKISENSVAKETTHDWYIFDAKNSMNEDEIIEGVTAVTPVTVFMFAGHNRLPSDSIMEAKPGNNMSEDYSDSENEDSDDNSSSSMKIDEWISFKSDPTLMQHLLHLRQKWSALLLRRLKNPAKPLTTVDETLIRNIVNILTEEEQYCGLFQPENIGQRPKQLS